MASVHGLKCAFCDSERITPTVRDWASCQACGKGMTQGEAMLCDEWCEECLKANHEQPAGAE